MQTRRLISGLLVSGFFFLAQGCTSVTEKFTGTEREQIKPFAQKTVDVLVVEDVQIRDNELVHLRRYVDDTFEELDELQRYMRRVGLYRKKLVDYTIELVRLTGEHEEEADRIAAYAEFLEQMIGETELSQLGISDTGWGEILANIRSQETFLHALRSFQPVIAIASSDFAALVARIESELLVNTRTEFDRRIESSFREVNELLSILHGKRKELLAAMIAVEEYRAGNDRAIAEFRQADSWLGPVFASDAPDEGQLAILERDLRERISYSTRLIAEMDADYENYVKTRAELDRKEREVREALTVARLQVETWTRAHNALAKGVKEPGELMELTIDAARHYLIP